MRYLFILCLFSSCSFFKKTDIRQKTEYKIRDADLEDMDQFIDSPQTRYQAKKGKQGYVRSIIFDNIKSFQSCYYKHRHLGQSVRGKVTLVFTVLSNGKIQRAGVGESSLPLQMKACLVEVIYSLRFPSLPDGKAIKVQQPLNF